MNKKLLLVVIIFVLLCIGCSSNHVRPPVEGVAGAPLVYGEIFFDTSGPTHIKKPEHSVLLSISGLNVAYYVCVDEHGKIFYRVVDMNTLTTSSTMYVVLLDSVLYKRFLRLLEEKDRAKLPP